MPFVRDLRVAVYSLIRTPGLAIAVVLTLSLALARTLPFSRWCVASCSSLLSTATRTA